MFCTTFDVLILGAGISGIGAACTLQRERPGTTFAILEARSDLGGTWDLFRYPGIRSDSDLFTFAYEFRPWKSNKAIADGAAIKSYIADTAREYDVDRHIRYHHKVVQMAWSSDERRWTVQVERTDTGEHSILRTRWIFSAVGYYQYDEGFTPHFDGLESFKGRVIHPQQWPEDVDWANKRVIVIGSGATAVTLVPALARDAAHVTMLQRTPTYVLPVPSEDPVARRLRPWFGDSRTYALTRRFNIGKQRWVYSFCQRFPKLARRLIRRLNSKMLPPGYPVDVHFNPPYEPWDQRLCAVPGGDLFRSLSTGSASIVTDRIRNFTETGVQLQSGQHLEADLVVTATGLKLRPFGGIPISVDGKAVHLPETVAFKGMMLSGVPNLAFAIGYTSSSWTLKVGLLCDHFCRLLAHMDERQLEVCTPQAPPGLETAPLLNFGAGYVQRSLTELPKQGKSFPWSMGWNYADDERVFKRGDVADENLRFISANTTV